MNCISKKGNTTPLSALFIWFKIYEMVLVPFLWVFYILLRAQSSSVFLISVVMMQYFFHGVSGRTWVQTTWRSTVFRGQSCSSLMLKWRWSKFFRSVGFNVSQQVSGKTQWQLQYQSIKAYLIYLLFMIWSREESADPLFLYVMTITAGWGDSKIMQIKMMPS